jgi:hypothetical protein
MSSQGLWQRWVIMMGSLLHTVEKLTTWNAVLKLSLELLYVDLCAWIVEAWLSVMPR